MSALWWIFIFVLLLRLSLGLRKIEADERGRIIRFGRPLKRIAGPGTIFLLPFIDRLERISIQPFSASLPPITAITSDEIPIQLVASIEATVQDPQRAVLSVKDWRVSIVSQLQTLMKDRLEDLDFDNLQTDFPNWVKSIENELEKRGGDIGIAIARLEVSNLSPRTKPSQ